MEGDNVIFYKKRVEGYDHRQCRTCKKAAMAAWWQENKVRTYAKG